METTYRRAGHSVSLLYAHLVFVTKYRRRVFNNAMLTDCEHTLREVRDVLGAESVEFNGEADHVSFWTPSYFAVSAGGAPLSTIKQYIETQARAL